MLKIIKEAVIGDYRFTLGPDYFAITLKGEEMVHLNPQDAGDLVMWLGSEMFGQGHILPTTIPKSNSVEKKKEIETRKKEDTCDYYPDDRKASQTVELKLGDPNLAYNASGSSSDGRQMIKGVEVVDLGALKRAQG